MELACYEEGFRLNDAVSICSMKSKAMIDTLFEDSKSMCSSVYADCYGSIYDYTMNSKDVTTEAQQRANGAVQAKIEAMFASIEAEAEPKGERAVTVLPVKYLGAAPVGSRITSVHGLQEPLRQLLECISNPIPAELEVSQRGLTFRTSELIEVTNPFRRIAVWSALRLRSRPISESTICQFHHAFIPLVGDDQTSNDAKHTDLYRIMRGFTTNVKYYPPIFAVVMRRPGAVKVLECHAFACETEDDAVTAAATLYRALLADLDSNRRCPKQTNGLGCVSLASVTSSSFIDYSPFIGKNAFKNRSQQILLSHPIRPPRGKKNSTSSSTTECESIKSTNSKNFRQKKIPEIRTGDIAEPREQQVQLTDTKVPLKVLSDNILVLSNQRNNRQSKLNEYKGRNGSIEDNANVIDVRYGDDNTYSYETNVYEKMTQEEKLSDSNRNYFCDAKNDRIVDEVINSKEAQLLEKNLNLYDSNEDRKKKKFATESNSTRSMMYEVPSSIRSKKNNCGSCGNSIHDKESNALTNCKNKLHQNHFKDVEKIFSREQEDIFLNSQFKKDSLLNEPNNIPFVQKHIENKSSMITNNEIDTVNSHSKRKENFQELVRIHRTSRIDEFSKEKFYGPLSRNAVLSDSQYQKKKKKDRAGSEPPLSRTENIAKTIYDIKLQRSQSDLDIDRGDLLTRVELPRRGSFLTQNSRKQPNSVCGGTPLGFTELFDEFRNQEGLTSVDDILDAIIADPEGMSFNELKPLYKEFLLKLASTLTQDELYQRSANIMRRRRRPQRQRSTQKPCLLGRAIKRSVSKLKAGPTEFTSVIFPARKSNESFDSSSSYDVRICRNRVLASRLNRRKSSWRKSKRVTTSEDDTCKRPIRSAGANRSSSGYVSCSECSYDSESCTCISADKCYCSLSRRSPMHNIAHKNATVCGCDTDSCSDSNKCYCTRRSIKSPTTLEQVHQYSIVPSEGTLSKTGNSERSKLSKTRRNHASSQSLELHKMHLSPARSSSDNLALDYDLFSPEQKVQCSSKNKTVLVVSARDTHGRLVYVGGADKNKTSFPINAIRTESHHEALSIKKNAEIAAVFGPASRRICKRSNSNSSIKSSISLEAGLGYLP